MERSFSRVGVIGAGAMGRGIVQLFAQSGFEVRLHDAEPEAVEAAYGYLRQTFDRLVEKQRLGASEREAALARVTRVDSLEGFAGCDLVIEAIVERLDIKRAVFRALEDIVDGNAVLASNTSSLSITAIAAACERPARVAGFHFFNPVPLMKVVEVVRGLRTDEAVVERLVAAARAAGHTPVVCQDTPGFIVNHAGRGFGTEALKALGEGVADTVTIDRILREQVNFAGQGFKLGPFELLDLTGLDVSHPVMESIYHQYFEEPRFRPSVIGAQRVAAGLLGRKTKAGFYRYDGEQSAPPEEPAPALGGAVRAWVGPGPTRREVRELVSSLGAALDEADSPGPDSILVVTPLGSDATTAARGLDATRVVALDTLFPFAYRGCKRRVVMTTPATDAAVRERAHALFAADGARVSVLRDSAGFVAQRVVAMIVSIGTEIAQQRIASPADIDAAVKLGLGYPLGPLAMGDALGPARVFEVLHAMHAATDDPRYRVGPWLRRRAALGLSLLHED
ncbi:MAG TPA: 3-hydroxyacyl-CoA dehydrogenase [Burkholderiaceae bacterium]